MFRNFRNVQKKKIPSLAREIYTAEVDKVNKFLWFELVTTVGVFAHIYYDGTTSYWRYLDTGQRVEGFEVEGLFLKYQIDNA